MIPIVRVAEPASLAGIRAAELKRIAALGSGHVPTSKDIGDKYQTVGDDLWKMQHYKCAYCESQEQRKRNDVEHMRPKSSADRRPGSTATHGYWWLAWTWENLLFACRNCNQSPYKLTKFPLDVGSTPLVPHEQPPGAEKVLLIDPCLDDARLHIQFRAIPRPVGPDRWIPVPRAGSVRGDQTIRVCGLDRPDLLGLYSNHVACNVKPEADRVNRAIATGDAGAVAAAWDRAADRLLSTSQPFIHLSADALDHHVGGSNRAAFGLVTALRPVPIPP